MAKTKIVCVQLVTRSVSLFQDSDNSNYETFQDSDNSNYETERKNQDSERKQKDYIFQKLGVQKKGTKNETCKIF